MSGDNTTIIICGECGTNLKIPSDKGNLKVTCPVCKTQFVYYADGIDYSPLDSSKERRNERIKLNTKQKTRIFGAIVALLFLIVLVGGKDLYNRKLVGCSHNWIAATCTSPKTCSKCGETDGIPLGHDWIAATDTTPKMCSRCNEMVAKALPLNGEVLSGKDTNRGSKLTVNCSSSQSCYVKMKTSSGQEVFSFFVRAGQTATVDVPKGDFQVFFACGTNWYGTKYRFGNETVYSKDNKVLDFWTYTWEYTLYPVSNGNFTQTIISADEF